MISFDRLRQPVKESDRRSGPFPYYGASGIVDHVDQYIFDGDYLLVAEDGENLRTRQTPIAFMATGKFWVNNHAHVIHANSIADTRYLMYALRVADVAAYLTGSTMPKLTAANLARIPIPCRPLNEQRAIAGVLGALDDKIHLNDKMSATLAAMARALFKSWFVNFDPVRAKIEGCDTGLSSEIAALFPDSFQESELGKVPAGWEVARLGDLASFEYGKPLKAADRAGGAVPVYGSNGIVGWHNEALVRGPGVVVGRKGNPGTVTWAESDFYPIDTTFFVLPKDEISLPFLFFALSDQDLPHLSADSAVPGLNRNHVYMSRQLLPPRAVLHAFDSVITSIRARTHHAGEESKTLAALRGTLLPKLISGEIPVTDAECIMAKSA